MLLLAAAACSPSSLTGSGGSGNRIVTPPPEARPSGASASGTPTPANAQSAPGNQPGSTHLRGHGLAAADLYPAYRALLDTYVDPVDGAQLLDAARQSLKSALDGQPLLPMMSLPLQLAPPPSGNPDHDWLAFGDAFDAVVAKLPAWADQAHPDWLVLRAMADSLHDGHTALLTPDEARRRNETSFGGIGILLSRPQDSRPPLIAEIYPNSPAASSGLKRGDRIVAVDGQDLTGKSVAEVANVIRGPRGTEVRLRVQRLSSAQPLEFTLRRAQVNIDQVIGRQVGSTPIGYLRVRSFSDPTVVEQVLGILDSGRQRGIQAWIVDLRNNPGGSLQVVVAAAGAFLDPQHTVVGYQVDRQRHQTPLNTEPLDLTHGLPMVMLVDHDTAAGAEILVAAVKEANPDLSLVGARTAGNVGVAGQLPLADGSVLQVTQQRFVSPSGAQLDGAGVTPDQPVDLSDEDLQNDRDPQLAKALETVVEKLRRG